MSGSASQAITLIEITDGANMCVCLIMFYIKEHPQSAFIIAPHLLVVGDWHRKTQKA